MAKKTILVICAHDDDDSVAMLGSILHYIDEGYRIVKVIFSRGEKSHPHLKTSVISRRRKQETKKVAEEIGIKKVIHFNLEDTKINEKITEDIKEKLRLIIEKYKPEKIFTLSNKDTHPDHRAVNKVVLEIIDSNHYPYPIYTFQVWNIFSENLPILHIDISDYFKEKIRAMKLHKSQWLSIYLQLIPTYLRAILNGIKYNRKYVEIFYKIR